ncbi:MAG: amidohydrolase family protein [Chloroflexi bacterium]|nr:amidohydrolase family protein [Chloroflexota bacterium]MDA1173883.1 amidohydrolase family protein [Chloroflexota bacterium]
MVVNERTLLISADSHVSEPTDLWEERLPLALRDRAPHFGPRGQKRRFDHPGGMDPAERANEMAADGVSAEVLYPTYGLGLYKMTDAVLQEASFRVYNEWIRDYCRDATAPVYPIGLISTYDIDNAIKELEWCHHEGFPGAMVWQVPPEGLSFLSNHYDPLWDAAQQLEMPISVHILTGFNYSADRSLVPNDIEASRNSVNTKTAEVANTVFDFIFSGTLERFPRLKFVIVEGEIGWLPFSLQQWDYYYDRFRDSRKLPISQKPSDYFYRQMYATFFNDPVGGQLLSTWGQDNCLWSNDYPHGNSQWPNSVEMLERNLGHLPPDVIRKLVQDNVAKLYGRPLA